MKKTLDFFIERIGMKSTNEILFRFADYEYQVSYWGRYILVEDSKTHEAEEFCFSETGKSLIEALLDASPRGITIRKILTHLSENDLIITK